jgi:hypothetical protein
VSDPTGSHVFLSAHHAEPRTRKTEEPMTQPDSLSLARHPLRRPTRILAAAFGVVGFILGCSTGATPDPAANDAALQVAHDEGYAEGFEAGQDACQEIAVADLGDKSKQEEWLKLPCIRLVGEVAASGPAKVVMASTQEETPAVKAARKAAKDAGGKEVSAKVELKKKAAGSIESAARSALLSKAQFLGYSRVVEAIIKVDCGGAKCTADASGVAVKE